MDILVCCSPRFSRNEAITSPDWTPVSTAMVCSTTGCCLPRGKSNRTFATSRTLTCVVTMRWSTSRNCPMTRSASTIANSPSRSTTAAVLRWPRSARRLASPASCTRLRAVSTASPPARTSPKHHRQIHKLLMPNARSSSNATFLRNATAFGASPRMRFDIVLNNLAGLAWTTKEIKMISDGTPWRPLVHVLDICDAVVATLDVPREIVHNQIFNVGDNAQNYRVREIAEIVADVFPGCQLSFGANGADNRSYRVGFDKITSQLPGFRCQRDARVGAQELRGVFEKIQMTG